MSRDRRLDVSDFSPVGEGPYQRAAAVWDARTEHMASQARNWRWAALIALMLAASSSLGWWLALARAEVLPVVVRIGELGNVMDVVPSASGSTTPNQREIRYFLGEWIKKVRGLPLDPVIARENWLTAYGFTTREAANKLNSLAEARDPFERLGEDTVSVTIQSIVQRSEATYEIRWQEATFSTEGLSTDTVTYTGLISIQLIPSEDLDTLTTNPLGLYITTFDWSLDHS